LRDLAANDDPVCDHEINADTVEISGICVGCAADCGVPEGRAASCINKRRASIKTGAQFGAREAIKAIAAAQINTRGVKIDLATDHIAAKIIEVTRLRAVQQPVAITCANVGLAITKLNTGVATRPIGAGGGIGGCGGNDRGGRDRIKIAREGGG
jgi:hypothetical protein